MDLIEIDHRPGRLQTADPPTRANSREHRAFVVQPSSPSSSKTRMLQRHLETPTCENIQKRSFKKETPCALDGLC